MQPTEYIDLLVLSFDLWAWMLQNLLKWNNWMKIIISIYHSYNYIELILILV